MRKPVFTDFLDKPGQVTPTTREPIRSGPVQGPQKPTVADKIAPKLTAQERAKADSQRAAAKAKKSFKTVRIGKDSYDYEFTGWDTLTPTQKTKAINDARADILANDPTADKKAPNRYDAGKPVTYAGDLVTDINTGLGMIPQVQMMDAYAKTAPGKFTSEKLANFSKAINVQVPESKFYDREGVQMIADLTVNAPSQLVQAGSDVYNENVDNLGKASGAAQIALAGMGGAQAVKAGKTAFDIARKGGAGVGKAVAKGVGSAVAENIGFGADAPTSQADNFSDAIGAPRAAGQGADDVSGIVPEPPGAVKPTTPEASPSAGAVSAKPKATKANDWELTSAEFYKKNPVLYHGGPELVGENLTRGGKNGFDMGGIFFTDSRKYAEQYAKPNVYESRKSDVAKNIFDPQKENHVKKLREGFLQRWREGEYDTAEDAIRDYEQVSKMDLSDWATGSQYGEEIEKAGFDGAKFRERPGEIRLDANGRPEVVPGSKPVYSIASFGNNIRARKSLHKSIIEDALNAGETVPQRVLDEYPDLKPPSPQPDIPTARPAQAAEDVPVTSARKAMVADDRAAMGLDELDDAVRKSFGESLDNARTKGYDGAWATREAESVTAKPRALNDEETAGMVDAMTGLKKQHKSVLEQIANETDPAKLDRLRDDLAGIEKQFDGISEAVKLSGTEKGRALASQKITLNEDFDLISVKSQAKAKKGEDLTAKETAKYEDLVNRLTEVDAKIADLELKNIDLQNALDSMPKGAKPGRRIARTDVEIKAARTDALSKWSKSVTSSPMGAGIDPTAYDYKALGQYIATFAEEGVGKVEDVIRAAIASAKASGIEISEADAKKGLLEWGTPKKSNREMDVAIFQRDRLRKEIRSSIQSHEESRLKRAAREITALPRAAQSTLDFSGTLRQGILLGAGNPMKAAWAYGKALRATLDPVYSAKLDRLLYSTPQALRRKRAKLYLANGEATNLAEEAFMSNWINKIPGVGILTKGAERHYTTFLNQLRSTVFDAEMARYPDMSVDQQKALADFVNVATGRGRVPDGAAEFLSHGFFSPRFTASRIQAPLDAIGVTPNGRAMWKSPAARAQMLKSWGSMIATGATMAALAKEFGAEVELADVDSSDWGKIKIGDTRYDIWGGFLPQVRMLARLAKLGKSGNKAGYKEAGRDIVADFLKYKMSPNANMIDAAISKQDAVGNPMFINKEGKVTPGAIVEDLPKFYSPLIVKELADLWGLSFDVDALEFKVESNTPMGAKVAGTILAPHGVGVNTYKKK